MVLLGVVKKLQIYNMMLTKCCSKLFSDRSESIFRYWVRWEETFKKVIRVYFLFFLYQLQADIGSKAPTYLKDIIGRLSSFTDEPRLAGLLGSVVSMVIDMAYTSSKSSSGGKGKSAGSSSSQVKIFYDRNILNIPFRISNCKILKYMSVYVFRSPAENLGAPGIDGGIPEAC